ncbi:hypothetical protein O181_114910 [Austropuccinia psidii MF-1]|uniref:Uncharacterized protein n=1 Tax=Austropuccinia psidii MF-1 TaxID=1389203 RepID=A0A9Q3PVY7_9BASI|nr:hypothetical protein [Austropuccinia psidii MF-1]
MPVQHSPPEGQTRSQAVLTPTPRAPLDGTPVVPQLKAHFGRKEEGQEDQGPGEEEEENSVEEEEYEGTEGIPAPVGASQGAGGTTLAQSNQPVSHQSEPSLLAIMQKIT